MSDWIVVLAVAGMLAVGGLLALSPTNRRAKWLLVLLCWGLAGEREFGISALMRNVHPPEDSPGYLDGMKYVVSHVYSTQVTWVLVMMALSFVVLWGEAASPAESHRSKSRVGTPGFWFRLVIGAICAIWVMVAALNNFASVDDLIPASVCVFALGRCALDYRADRGAKLVETK